MRTGSTGRRDGQGPTTEITGTPVLEAVECASTIDRASALLDDEASVADQQALAVHLESCVPCRTEVDRLALLTRQVRLRSVEAVPDVATRVLDRARPPRLGRGGWIRPTLVVVALVLAAQSVDPLVFGELHGASTHVARHVGAFSMALAIGLVYAAWRPHRAFGLLPLAGALTLMMVAAAVLDVASGHRSLQAEIVHLPEIAGLVLLWLISGSPGLGRRGSGRARRATTRSDAP